MRALLLLTAAILSFGTPRAHAYEQIYRPYQSVRGAGMGGLLIMTGLYEDNFFGNPARVAANPRSKFTLLNPSIETSLGAISTGLQILGGTSAVTAAENNIGSDTHVRFEMTPFSFYIAPKENRRWGLGFSILTSVQADVALRGDQQVSAQALADAGASLSFAYKFHLFAKDLAVGTNLHGLMRGNGSNVTPLYQVLQGNTSAIVQGLFSNLYNGTEFDFDLGATYDLPIPSENFKYSVGVTVNNIIGGAFTDIPLVLPIPKIKTPPLPQSRTFGVGFAVRRDAWWKFKDLVLAVESQDIGYNANGGLDSSGSFVAGGGSFFRTLHIGAEARFAVLLPRIGLNQGYWTLGLGIDLKYFMLDVSTYGEEMGLNTGTYEDRRIAAQITILQI